ncbi:HEPN domain-containing protein [Hymenobacter sp. 5317J-9]|uniref:HEPN domain-containing protein n=1 Tax=Hymenobacter sp. 5317J-9 TaxID=2932250 RepID=UPI001FD70379|nr:HEPN domain-containing protein [Hymenobacter sp. 5317J-9]UOQ96091.1 HEPN domain-containing protein [Hymenobacter sp. 5317J-9]
MSSNDDIKIEKGNVIKFKDLTLSYEVQTGEVNDKEQRFFHTKFVCKEINKIEEYSTFLRSVRDIFFKITGKQPVSLWDDISLYYATKAYPMIHEIENLMRKFLTKFSITKLESNWIDKNIPEEVKTSVKSNSSNNDANYLYQTDFIQLINFLSGKIKTSSVSGLLDIIKGTNNVSELNLDELKSFIPTNNWDRYFSSIVEFEWDYLEKRWRKLYDLRCKVAHNNFLNKKDYDDVLRYFGELKPKLQTALDKMDEVKVSDEDQEELAESFAISSNSYYEDFINDWKLLEYLLVSLVAKLDGSDESLLLKKGHNPRIFMKVLFERGLIDSSFVMKFDHLRNLRNDIVHNLHYNASENDIRMIYPTLKWCIGLIKGLLGSLPNHQ